MPQRREDLVERARNFLAGHGADLARGTHRDLAAHLDGRDAEESLVVSELWRALHGAAGETVRLPRDGLVHRALAEVERLRADPASLATFVDRALQQRGAKQGPPAIPGYELSEQIGRGGQGRVYRGRDLRSGAEVAIKVLPPSAGADDVQRLRREGALAARLDDPCICKAFEVGECEHGVFVAMQYVAGESLARRLAAANGAPVDVRPDPRAGTPNRALFRFLEQAARALARMHAAGVLHRDVKPGNIMVTDDGRPVLLDLGLARADTDATLTLTGDFFGTVDYMAPELLGEGPAAHDERSEVWSLGIVLFECLTGSRPFAAATRAGTAEAVRRATLPAARLHGLPRDVRAVVETALARDPDHRYRDAARFADDLGRLARGEAVAARSPGRLVRTVRLARRHPAVTLALLLIVALPVVWALEALAGERRAKRYLVDALATVESMLVDLASVDLDDMPGGAALRRRLLDEASRRYERLAADGLLGDEIHVQIARVELELARLASEEGLFDLAEQRVASARQRTARVAGRADVPALLHITATADRRQAALLMARGEHRAARALLESARTALAAGGSDDAFDRTHLDLQLADALRRCGELDAAQAMLAAVAARSDNATGAAARAVAGLCLVQVHRSRGDAAAATAAQRATKRAVIDALIEAPNRHLLAMLCLHELYDVDERRAIPDPGLVDASMTRAATVLGELAAQFPHWRQVDLIRWQYFARGVEIYVASRASDRLDETLDAVAADLDAAGEATLGSRRMAEAACAMLTRIAAAMAGQVENRPELASHLARLTEQLRRVGPVPGAAELVAQADWDCVTRLVERAGSEGGAASRPSAALARAVSSGLRELGGKLLGKRDLDAALEHYETAYALMQGATAQDSSRLNRRYLLYPTSRRGITLMMMGRWEEAIGYLEEALPLFLEEAAVRNPSRLQRHWNEYGPERRSDVMVAAGDRVPPEVCVRLARLLARALEFLERDERLAPGDRLELRTTYLARCRELAAIATAGGYDLAARPEDQQVSRVLRMQ